MTPLPHGGPRVLPHLSRFSAYLLMMLGAMVAFVGAFYAHVQIEGKLQQAHTMRLKSLLLANELRQSSNDLTRLVRTYVITGDVAFKNQFQSVLGIRDGTEPRPKDYGPSYWDFAATGRTLPQASGVSQPLLDLMRQAGFTDSEFAQLAQSKAKSDELTRLEFEAMALVEADNPPDPTKRLQAIQMLHDESFHHAKVDIMRPISEFDRLVNDRTLTAVQEAASQTAQMRLVLIALGLFFLYLLWAVSRQLYAILGCSAPELQHTISRLGSGDFFSPVEVQEDRQNSVLGWVVETQKRLAKLELLQFKAIVDSSDDAIIGKTTTGIITSWNRGAERIFGYTAEEAIGQPMLMLIPPDRAEEEPAILARICRGEQVEHFETVRRRKDGRLINISTTISPIRDHTGKVIGASKIARDVTQAKMAESEIHRLAYYDSLTGLPNRRLLYDRLNHAMRTSRRHGQGCAIMFIDLDNFKTLNDTRGHDVGDLLLQQVGQRLGTCVREGDTVARFGGDEFVVVLEGQSQNTTLAADRAETVGGKILDLLSQPYLLDGHQHYCTPSIGITLFSGGPCTTDELLKQADLAMYRSKSLGRNTMRFFDPEMQTIVDQHALMERDIREALNEGQFRLHYQPQMGREGCLSGAEALLRWHHPTRGMIPPGDFIPRAEETGQILQLGRWVLETACEQLAAWSKRSGFERLTIAVNVSARQFYQADFTQQLLDMLDRTGVNPRQLKLELTESMLALHVEEIIQKMSILKAHGVRFSLDDFGTGYSSLAYLKRMPLDELKIDQGFVRDVLTDANDAAIAKMIVVLADSMGIEVMAEGVETEAQRDFLATLGCGSYQGYLLSRPLPIEFFETFVNQHAASMVQKNTTRCIADTSPVWSTAGSLGKILK